MRMLFSLLIEYVSVGSLALTPIYDIPTIFLTVAGKDILHIPDQFIFFTANRPF